MQPAISHDEVGLKDDNGESKDVFYNGHPSRARQLDEPLARFMILTVLVSLSAIQCIFGDSSDERIVRHINDWLDGTGSPSPRDRRKIQAGDI